MIDPSIISQGALQSQLQQQQNFESLGNLGSNLGRIIYGRRINQMQQLKTPEEQKNFANNSIFAPYLNAQLKTDEALKQKQVYDQLKTEADIAKTSSEASKNNAQAGGFNLDNSQKKFGAIQGVFQSAAMTGDKGQVLLGLDALKRTGAITPEDYSHNFNIIKEMSPDEIKQYASGIGLGNKDVAPYLYQSKNNEADNATSTANNMRTTNASIYSTDVGAQTADKNRAQQSEQFQQNLAFNQQKQHFEQNKPLGFETGSDGYRYAIYPNGKGIRVLGEDGQPLKVQPKNGGQMSSTAQKELFETTDAITAGNNAITNLKDALKYSSKAYDGVGASQRAGIRGMIGGGSEEATATAMLDNITTGNALEQLKATFGGAPTEGERAILLQLQGSANMPRAQREAIYTRALQMAENRIKSNQAKAESLRNGSFFKPDQEGVNSSTALDSYSFMP
ncbi:hypothetical protein [Acinetobacter bereziniae]|uniref:hypothetical protein n=1 Tax=Acinetobacter bereziniae TaxID=106648 RepID=UPI000EF688F2|nr:hypothetical protein [Acinetobacter bereziniae]